MFLVSLVIVFVQALLMVCLVYHWLLTAASVRESEPAPLPAHPVSRIAVAIPAHNEAQVLPATLHHLRMQDYPPELFDVFVLADHCTDDTAAVSQRMGAEVHERNALPKGRKAYALQDLLQRILADRKAYDAVAIFDADSCVDHAFLRQMDCCLQAGDRALQGQHAISNPQDSPLAAMAAVDMRLNNRLRNQSRRNLGLACRLMGDAMVFQSDVLRAYGWPAESLTEDREYGYELLLRGIRARYVPEAKSHGQAASGWQQAEPQRLRWYRGAGAMRRRLAGRLLREAVRSGSPALLDGFLELTMPAYSVLAAASVANLLVVGLLQLLGSPEDGFLGLAGSAAVLAAWGIYPVAGLVADRAPAWAYRALLLGPAYLLWRLWISLKVRVLGDRIAWVRTPRREEPSGEATRGPS